MDSTTSSHIPRARSKGLLVEHLDDETLVYDLSSHEAHCLNKAAAHVWGMADGEYTVAQIAGTLPDVGLPADESIVAASLGDLTAAELLVAPDPPKTWTLTRRQALRALGLAVGASLFPTVDSIAAPLASSAASCLTVSQCQSLNTSNCMGLPICGDPSECCVRRGSSCRARACP